MCAYKDYSMYSSIDVLYRSKFADVLLYKPIRSPFFALLWQSKGLVTKAMENVENLASAVLTQKFAGEPATEVKTERLSMAVQRADPSGSGKIGAKTGGGDFMMPDVAALFGIDGNNTKKLPPVDTKVGRVSIKQLIHSIPDLNVQLYTSFKERHSHFRVYD